MRIESYRLGVVYSSALNIVAKILAFAVSVIIAFFYGTQDAANVFFYAFNTVSLLAAFVRGMNAAVLIPEFMRVAEQESSKDAMAFLNFFLYAILAVCGAVTLALLIHPLELFLTISNFNLSTLAPHRAMLTFTVPLFLLMVMAALMTDILVARKFFTIPMILNCLNSLMVIVAVVLFRKRLDVASVIVGLFVGFLLQCGLLIFMMRRLLNWRFRVVEVCSRRGVWKDLSLVQLGNAATAFSSYVPLMLLSGFGQGLIAALNYSRNIMELPENLLSGQVSAVAGIKFNELCARKQWPELDRVFQITLRLLVFVLVPLSGLMFLYSREIVNLLFSRGRFTGAAVTVTADLLRYLSPLVPIVGINTVCARLLMAGRKIPISVWSQLLVNLLAAGCIALGVHWFGYVGYPLARVAVSALHVTVVCFLLFKFTFPILQYGSALRYTLRVLILNVGICGVLYGLGLFVPVSGDVARLGVGIVLYVAILILSNAVFRVNPEIATCSKLDVTSLSHYFIKRQA